MKPGHPVNSLCRPALVTSFRESVQQVWASTATLKPCGLEGTLFLWAMSGLCPLLVLVVVSEICHHRCVPGDFRPFHASTHSQALCRGSSPYPTGPKRLPDDSLTMLSQCYYCVKAPITATWDSTTPQQCPIWSPPSQPAVMQWYAGSEFKNEHTLQRLDRSSGFRQL